MTGAQKLGVGAAAALAAAGGLAYALFRKPEELTITDDEESIPDEPRALALAAGVTPGVYTLARIIASEEGGQPVLYQRAVGYAVRNEAAHQRKSVLELALGSGSEYGRQGTGGRGYVSTARAPIALQLRLAQEILDDPYGDLVDGATHFDSPKGQRAQLAAGTPGVTRTPEEVGARRRAQGFEQVYPSGINSDDLRLWRRV